MKIQWIFNFVIEIYNNVKNLLNIFDTIILRGHSFQATLNWNMHKF